MTITTFTPINEEELSVMNNLVKEIYGTSGKIKPFITTCCEQRVYWVSNWDKTFIPQHDLKVKEVCEVCGESLTRNIGPI